MAHIEKSIDLDVPVRVAYDQWTQFASFPMFMEGVKEVHQVDDTHLHWKAEIGGKAVEWDAVIAEQVPDQRIAWRNTDGATNAGVVTFQQIGEAQCRVMLQMETEPHGLVETVGDALGFLGHQVEGDLKRFKEMVEGRGAATGAWRGSVDDGQRTS